MDGYKCTRIILNTVYVHRISCAANETREVQHQLKCYKTLLNTGQYCYTLYIILKIPQIHAHQHTFIMRLL